METGRRAHLDRHCARIQRHRRRAAIRRMDKPALIALIEQMRNDRGADVIRVPRPQASIYHPTMNRRP